MEASYQQVIQLHVYNGIWHREGLGESKMSFRVMKTLRHRNEVSVSCLAFAFPERDIANGLTDSFWLFDAIYLHFVQIRYIVIIICALLVVSPIYNPIKE